MQLSLLDFVVLIDLNAVKVCESSLSSFPELWTVRAAALYFVPAFNYHFCLNLSATFTQHILQHSRNLSIVLFSPRTEDDPFVLLTALHLGPGARILSNDAMRQHHAALSSLHAENGCVSNHATCYEPHIFTPPLMNLVNFGSYFGSGDVYILRLL